jgi:hypothetical protein
MRGTRRPLPARCLAATARRAEQAGAAALRTLRRHPTGTRVETTLGAVYVWFRACWMVAGVIGEPVTSRALLVANDGVPPVVLVAAGRKRRAAS